MKKLQLPISNAVSKVFDLHTILQKPAVKGENGRMRIELGTIDMKAACEQTNQARENASFVIWATISIEKRFNQFIANSLFGPVVGEPKPNRDFFINHILNSDALSFAKKRVLVAELATQLDFVNGKEKDNFLKLTNRVMRYRNAFAHGEISADANRGAIVHFFSGGASAFDFR